MSGFYTRVCCLAILASLTACQSLVGQSVSNCRPLGYDKDGLLALKATEFKIDDTQQRQRFALQLLDCLDEKDPQLRDGIAYEAFVTLLRGKQLDPDTINQLRVRLLGMLEVSPEDPLGFRQPFASLTLAEVARVDRLSPLFTDTQRAELLRRATAYMTSITDYRGYDEVYGWRHGVAHTADLLLQLSLNPAINADQLTEMARAVASQVAPPVEHFYIYGEYERLARPIYYIALRGELSEQQWADWFTSLASPAPFADWSAVWKSQAGLAKLHNTRLYAQTINRYANSSEAAELQPLIKGSNELLKALP